MARYIDADKLWKSFSPDGQSLPYVDCDNNPVRVDLRLIRKIIINQPIADVEDVKHGRWLPQILLGERVWDCSECKTLGSPHWKRCPICEAKMDGGNIRDCHDEDDERALTYCADFKNKADFVEVVRCKDCKHGEKTTQFRTDCTTKCMLHNKTTIDNDFCSYGERRGYIMAELKPCPFCGSKAEIVNPHNHMYIVGCSNQDCPMWCGLAFNVKEHAVKFWNTRTPKERGEE